MLKVPEFRSFPEFGVNAYQDDAMFWKFYLIPKTVSIRRDANGNPVFLLIKYAFGDQDREENPDLPRGGGYMVFDVEMTIPEENKNKILQVLQNDVDQIWNQLKAAAEAQGQPVQGARLESWHYLGSATTGATLSVGDVLLGLGPEAPEAPPGDRPPKVITADPTWTQGKFHIFAPQSEALISHRISEGPVSLVGGNVVSANMDLTSAGATFMERTLTNLDGSGATDLTPIQVLYELKFWARVPPVRVRVKADSRALYSAIQSIYHDYEGHGCDEDSIDHSEHHLQMAVQSGLITVQIDAADLQLSDDFIQEIRSSALKTVMDMIKDKFFDKKPAPPPPDDKTAEFVNRESDIYYMKTDMNFEAAHIEYSEDITSIREWPINPQGTLQTFLAGVSADEMRKYVRSANLADDLFKTLGLTATAFADWDNEPIAFIEAQLHYSGRDENNLPVEKVETFTFTKEHTTDEWDPSLIGSKREYEYRWRVGFEGHAPAEFTTWQRETTPRLNLVVANPGKIDVQVLAGNIDFSQVTKSAQVDLSYVDQDSGVLEESTTVLLNGGQLTQPYSRYIFTTWDKPLKYRTRFFLKNDQTIESDWQEAFTRQVLVNEPSAIRRLDVQLIPAGDWSNVVQTVVNLRYADPVNAYFSEGVYSIKSLDEFKTWYVVLKDPNKRKFQYHVATSFKDGSPPAQSNWLDAEGDQSLLITVQQSPRLQVKVLPQLVDFKATPIVTTTLHYDDPQANLHKVETLPFTGPDEAVWGFPIANEARRQYRYQVTYNTVDGQTIDLPEVVTDVNVLAVQKAFIPEIACEVHPKVVDFVQTPLVEVNVDFEDRDHDIDFSETLVFTDPTPQKFRFLVHKDSPREYQVAVTYYLANGQVVEKEPITLDKSKIVIPRYLPQA